MADHKEANGAEILLKVLDNWNTEYVFGCPGTTEVAILDALVGRDKPSFILAPQEGLAVSAADGYARVTGKPGVVCLHANVGLANGVSQIYSAQMAGVPLVVLNAIKHRSILSHGAFTTAHDHQEMVRQYTKWDWTTLRVEELRQDLNRAFQIALQPPMGPTYLALPQDILEEEVVSVKEVYPEGAKRKVCYARPTLEEIAEAAQILAECKFPLILSGSGVAVENCLAQVKELAETLGAVVCCENRLSLGYNTYPTNEIHFLGPYVPNHQVLSEVDVILAIGTKLFVEFQPPSQPWIPEHIRLIHLHDDLSEIGKLYPPEVGLYGSIRATIRELIEELKRLMADKQALVAQRNSYVAQLHAERLRRLETKLQEIKDRRPMKVLRLVQVLSEFIDENVTVVADAVTSNDPLVEYLPRHNVFSYYAGATGGSLGWGMGAAIGVKMGAPNRKVISVVGDGVFMFGVPALWMAQELRLPIVFIVINNLGYAAVKAGLLRYGGKASQAGIFPATDISGVNYAQVARGFGLAAERVDDPVVLGSVLEKALTSDGPFLLEVLTDPGDVGNLAR